MIGLSPSIGVVLALGMHLITMLGTWQHRIGGSPGEVVEGYDELEQTLIIAVATPMHSVAGRPGFGSWVHKLVDLPINAVSPELTQEVIRAVNANAVDKAGKPRLVVKSVTPTYDLEGKLVAEIGWLPAAPLEANAAMRTTRVQLG